jgi:hypothetical protein
VRGWRRPQSRPRCTRRETRSSSRSASSEPWSRVLVPGCAQTPSAGCDRRLRRRRGLSVRPGPAARPVAEPDRGRPLRVRRGSHQLPLDEPERRNAIHGLTRWLEWSAAYCKVDRVTSSTPSTRPRGVSPAPSMREPPALHGSGVPGMPEMHVPCLPGGAYLRFQPIS